jgi:hypothetical protein
MLSNERLHHCACRQHVFSADTSGRHTLMVDPDQAHLLRDVAWCTSPVRRGSKRLQARATSKSPHVRKGDALHRQALRVRNADRRVRAIDGNLLNCATRNLQVVTRSDSSVFGKSGMMKKIIGVRYAKPPKWMRTDCFWHAEISVGGRKVFLGAFPSPEQATAAFDAAAVKLGRAATNQRLGFLSEKAAKTRLCKRAAKKARNVIRDYQGKRALEFTTAIAGGRNAEKIAGTVPGKGQGIHVNSNMGSRARRSRPSLENPVSTFNQVALL